MASFTQAQYRTEERRVMGQPGQKTAWDDHLDGLLTDLNDALLPGQGSGPSTQLVRGPAAAVSSDLSAPLAIPGSEDFHERREFTSADRGTRTVQECSRHTERAAGGSNQLVSRQVIKSQSSSRTAEPSIGYPGVAPVRHELAGVSSAVGAPTPAAVPGTQSHMTQYEYRSSSRSVSPSVPRRQPPATLPKPRLPADFINDASTTTSVTTTAGERPPPPGAVTTINYHIYNYGADGASLTDSGVGTLERAAPGRPWQDSLERRAAWQSTTTGPSGQPPSPRPLVERQQQGSSVTTREERLSTSHRVGGAPLSAPGQTVTTYVETSRAADRSGVRPFPVERRTDGDSGQSAVLLPSGPQDGTYADGPRRRDLGHVTEVKSAAVVTELPETMSDAGQTSQSQSQTTPGVYYPPEQSDYETKFHSKESGKEGNTKTYFEASGKYKAKGGSKQKEAKGGKTIPVCLPCCAGAACSIM